MANPTFLPPELQHPGNRPRWLLRLQALFWRVLMEIGMKLHRLARPQPYGPDFYQDIESTISPLKGSFRLNFYVPKDYKRQRKLKGVKRYPVLVNFHGGGFVLGKAHDDARWCNIVVEQVGAVVIGVDYRLAPEYPFPTAVEDGADAILWLAQHANEYMLDSDRFAISGFSSGANMTFTVPLCLQGELFDKTPSGENIVDDRAGHVPSKVIIQPPPAKLGQYLGMGPSRMPVPGQKSRLDRIAALRQTGASTLSFVSSYKDGSAVSVISESCNTIIKIRGLVSFYPPTDYTQTRAQRRATCTRTDHQLPAVFTKLFDDSYLQPPSIDLAHPWLSPGVAPKGMLNTLPDDIVLFCCEWDMLLAEGERFRDILSKDLGKRVHYHCVPGVPHGWDKSPNPLRASLSARNQYLVACRELRRIFGIEEYSLEEGGHGELSSRDCSRSWNNSRHQHSLPATPEVPARIF